MEEDKESRSNEPAGDVRSGVERSLSIVERIGSARRDFQRLKGYKPERIVIHYEGWHEVLNDKDSEYVVRFGIDPPQQIMGMTVIRTADLRRTEFIVF